MHGHTAKDLPALSVAIYGGVIHNYKAHATLLTLINNSVQFSIQFYIFIFIFRATSQRPHNFRENNQNILYDSVSQPFGAMAHISH